MATYSPARSLLCALFAMALLLAVPSAAKKVDPATVNSGGGSGGSAGCACPKIYTPVCGQDQRTYGNECAAKCAGVDVAYGGRCADPAGCAAVACPADYTPVCGADGVTYSNRCNAECTGVTVVSEGECSTGGDETKQPQDEGFASPSCEGVVCTEEFAPVCGLDGKSYANKCYAVECAKTEVAYVGKCADPAGCAAVACPADYTPVCGADGVTYSNRCNAECTGVTVVSEGECGDTSTTEGGAEGGEQPGFEPIVSGCDGAVCTEEFAPVCGKDGKSYANKCLADKCGGTEVAYVGRCANPAGCAAVLCPMLYAPVCGADGKTYSNKCMAACTGVTIVSEHACEGADGSDAGTDGTLQPGDSCKCTKEFAPVCGSDKLTHSNACMAKCAGAEVAYEGRCANPDGCMLVRCAEGTPVCGADGVEYPSACIATCTGVSFKEGTCADGDTAGPKTGKGKKGKGKGKKGNRKFGPSGDGPKGKVGASECVQCEGVDASPVCGADGITYGSACLAQCSHVEVAEANGPCA